MGGRAFYIASNEALIFLAMLVHQKIEGIAFIRLTKWLFHIESKICQLKPYRPVTVEEKGSLNGESPLKFNKRLLNI